MNAIDQLFQNLRQQNRKAFIPFLTAGDPDLEITRRLAHEVARNGASLIEIGFPYSDPIADGSVIQASYTRALTKKLKVNAIFDMLRTLSREAPFQGGNVPLVGMVSFSLVYHRGPEKFIEDSRAAGLSGLIIPDLPVEESDRVVDLGRNQDFKIIQLVTPTTPRDRAVRIAQTSTGFLYCVSVVGITGERAQLPADLIQHLTWLRSQTKLPMCVGFGISKPEHVKNLRGVADGIIVGSAIVRKLEQVGTKSAEDVVQEIGIQVNELVAALNA